ncbi:MAG: hypothetical protein HY980_02410 [Candidatus Magasanikbacteria bacterium]|nr:hypothetical protein [Candidatus Magasanikbacteria bacterium]
MSTKQMTKLAEVTLDEMVTEARLEYFTGKTKSFTDTKQLLSFLNT